MDSESADVAAICLAAGGASRMGFPKQVAECGNEALLATVLGNVLSIPFACVVLVLGAYEAEVRRSLELSRLFLDKTATNLHIVVNSEWSSGMSSSLQCGLRSLREWERAKGRRLLGTAFCLGDMPLMTAPLLYPLWRTMCAGGYESIVAPCCGERRGNPVFLGRAYWTEVEQLRGDCGASAVVRRHRDRLILIESGTSCLFDVDTPQDLRCSQINTLCNVGETISFC